MWLNVCTMGFASMFVGFVVGWVMGRPRRWDPHIPHDQIPQDQIPQDQVSQG
jgi:hypothetical protein